MLVWLGAGSLTAQQAAPGTAEAKEPVSKVEAIPNGITSQIIEKKVVSSRKKSYEFDLTTGDWLDTGVQVEAGEQAEFSATGELTLADGRTSGPDGVDRGWKDLLRQFPLNEGKVGELIGRVSDVAASVPFEIGSSKTITVPAGGELYLRENLSSDLTGTGKYKIKLKFAAEKKAAGAAGEEAAGPPVSTVVTPENFADIPRRVSDLAGNKGDMVNISMLGTEAQVKAAFAAAGWVAVDKTVEDAVLHGILNTLGHEAYTEMPMSTLYLFGRPQDMSFARADPLMVAAERHHLRLWKTDKSIDNKEFWVGSCTHDIGFEKDQRNNGVTHKIDPDVDKERDYLLESFKAAGAFSSAAYVTPVDALTTARTATGGSFHSDGRILVMELK